MKDVNEMSTADLEQLLAKKKKKDKQDEQKKQKAYENNRDTNIEEMIDDAFEIVLLMERFKSKVHAKMDIQAEALKQYGKIRTDSKGGFRIMHSDGKRRVIRRRDTDPVWDERAGKGAELVKEFLHDTVKKRDAKVFELLMPFLEKNQSGDLDYANVMQLIVNENLFTEPKWVEGLRLIKESYTLSFKAFGYEFQTKNAQGKWEGLKLNFASV